MWLEGAKREEEHHEAEIRVQKYKEEIQFEKEKLEQKLKYEKKKDNSQKHQNKK